MSNKGNNISKGQRRRFLDPAQRKKRSDSQKKLWRDPEYRRKLMALKKEKGTYTNKKRNKAQSDLMYKLWNDNKYKKSQLKTRKSILSKERHYKGAIKSLVDGTAVVNSFGGETIKTIKGGSITCHGKNKLEQEIAWFLDSRKEVKKFRKDDLKVMYLLDGKTRIYFPDFYVKTILNQILIIEILSHQFGNTRKEKAKIYYVKEVCKRKGWKFLLLEIINKRDIEKAKNKIKHALNKEE